MYESIKVSANSSGRHSIRKSWDRVDHDPNPGKSDLYGWNHGSHPGEPQTAACIWDDSPRQPFCRSPNFCSNGVPWLYVHVVFQRDYTWSRHKNSQRQRATDFPTCYLFIRAWVGSTECSLPQDLVYYEGGDTKEHWRSHDGESIPWPHRHSQWKQFSAPTI